MAGISNQMVRLVSSLLLSPSLPPPPQPQPRPPQKYTTHNTQHTAHKWVQTGHSTCTCTVSLHVVELRNDRMGEALHAAKKPSENDHIEENKGVRNREREPQKGLTTVLVRRKTGRSCQLPDPPQSTTNRSKNSRPAPAAEGDGTTRQHNARVNRTVTPLRGGGRIWQRPRCQTVWKSSGTSRPRGASTSPKSMTGETRPPHRRLETRAPPAPDQQFERKSRSSVTVSSIPGT